MFAAVRNPGLYALNGYFFEEGVPPRSAAGGRIRPNRTPCLASHPSTHDYGVRRTPRAQNQQHNPYTRVTSQDAARCPDALGT